MQIKTKINIKKIIKWIVIIILILNVIPNVNSKAQNEQILMPFRYNEIWDTNVKNLRDDYGIHKDKIGIGIDFYTDQSSRVIAPVSGNISIGCIANGVTSYVITRSNGMIIRLIHLLDNTISKRSGWINQGESVGMTASRGNYNQDNCNVTSDDYHVHLSLGTSNPNSCSFNIDGYIFNCAGMKVCERTLNDKYPLSFKVDCNRLYLNQSFVSTNGFPLNNDQCNTLISQFYNNSIDIKSENSLNVQVCLRKLGLYNQIYSRVYDQYTKDIINKLIGEKKEKTRIENEKKLAEEKEAKDAEIIRLENEKKALEEKKRLEEEMIKQEKLKAEETKRLEEQKQLEQKKEQELQIKKLEEAKKIEDQKKIEQRNEDLKNIFIRFSILIAAILLFISIVFFGKNIKG
jgi:hypothetical protein